MNFLRLFRGISRPAPPQPRAKPCQCYRFSRTDNRLAIEIVAEGHEQIDAMMQVLAALNKLGIVNRFFDTPDLRTMGPLIHVIMNVDPEAPVPAPEQ